MEKNNLDKYTGILFELKIGLNKDNAIVIDYGGKPVGKVREALKGYPYHGNLDLCINQTKKKGTQSKYSVCLVVAC
jgi:hypothetical protein